MEIVLSYRLNADSLDEICAYPDFSPLDGYSSTYQLDNYSIWGELRLSRLPQARSTDSIPDNLHEMGSCLFSPVLAYQNLIMILKKLFEKNEPEIKPEKLYGSHEILQNYILMEPRAFTGFSMPQLDLQPDSRGRAMEDCQTQLYFTQSLNNREQWGPRFSFELHSILKENLRSTGNTESSDLMYPKPLGLEWEIGEGPTLILGYAPTIQYFFLSSESFKKEGISHTFTNYPLSQSVFLEKMLSLGKGYLDEWLVLNPKIDDSLPVKKLRMAVQYLEGL